jgi:hypothetical protein
MRKPNPHQGTGDWFNQRCGKLTGSRMWAAMAYLKQSEKDKKDKKPREDRSERKNLKIELIVERMTGEIVYKYRNSAMDWGIEQEPYAKEAYERKTGRLVDDVGFVDHPSIEYCGASPDGFVGEGLVEFKCPTTATHVQYILEGVIPAEHMQQMILQCACTRRPWCDFVSYDPRVSEGQQLFVRRFYPTPAQIELVETEARVFLREVDDLFERVTRQEMIL